MNTAAHWYVSSFNIHRELNVPMVKDEIVRQMGIYIRKVERHPNPLARNILDFSNHTRQTKGHNAALALNETTSIQIFKRMPYNCAGH